MIWFAAVMLCISVALNAILLTQWRVAQDQARRLERDRKIGELEREMRLGLPAIQADASPLVRLLGVIVGIWIADRHNYRRRY